LLVEEDVCDQIAAAADPELVEDRLQMIFDGLRGQVLVGAGGALARRRVERRDVPVAGGQ
jgi:hypothetical protein